MRALSKSRDRRSRLTVSDVAGAVQFKDPSNETAAVAQPSFTMTQSRRSWGLKTSNSYGCCPARRASTVDERTGAAGGGHFDYWGIYRFRGDGITGGLEYGLGTLRKEQLAEFMAYC